MLKTAKNWTLKFVCGSALVLLVGLLTAQGAEAKDRVPSSIFSDPAVVELGKALFWDMQVGSGNGAQSACATCHYQAGADSEARRVVSSTRSDGIIGSLGVRESQFRGISLLEKGVASATDDMSKPLDFLITDRQAPPTVESEFTHNFWDGRANNCFNGVDPGGQEGHRANGLYQRSNDGGDPVKATFLLCDASQASQAVGPPNSDVEMAAAGRTFPEIGFKMMRVKPLAMQTGDLAKALDQKPSGYYKDMIDDAFGDVLAEFIGDEPVSGATEIRVARGDEMISVAPTLTEQNFSLFWGLSIMAYELTLESHANVQEPTRAQEKSFKRMRCDSCHLTDGTSAAHVFTGKNGKAFISTGVAEASVDPGVVDDFVGRDTFEGNFKTTHLFNLPLTAPYFHDGSAADLSEMLDFYIKGGNRVDQKVKIKNLKGRIKKRDKRNVIAMLEGLTDPRIAEGSGPYGHPSLKLMVTHDEDGNELAAGAFFWMHASDSVTAQESKTPGLSYGGTETPDM
jgi:cytochrome c peroxidase